MRARSTVSTDASHNALSRAKLISILVFPPPPPATDIFFLYLCRPPPPEYNIIYLYTSIIYIIYNTVCAHIPGTQTRELILYRLGIIMYAHAVIYYRTDIPSDIYIYTRDIGIYIYYVPTYFVLFFCRCII